MVLFSARSMEKGGVGCVPKCNKPSSGAASHRVHRGVHRRVLFAILW
nr:MAG TPA: hypothetical protein [Caudoviricetes sp.]